MGVSFYYQTTLRYKDHWKSVTDDTDMGIGSTDKVMYCWLQQKGQKINLIPEIFICSSRYRKESKFAYVTFFGVVICSKWDGLYVRVR